MEENPAHYGQQQSLGCILWSVWKSGHQGEHKQGTNNYESIQFSLFLITRVIRLQSSASAALTTLKWWEATWIVSWNKLFPLEIWENGFEFGNILWFFCYVVFCMLEIFLIGSQNTPSPNMLSPNTHLCSGMLSNLETTWQLLYSCTLSFMLIGLAPWQNFL